MLIQYHLLWSLKHDNRFNWFKVGVVFFYFFFISTCLCASFIHMQYFGVVLVPTTVSLVLQVVELCPHLCPHQYVGIVDII